MGCKQLEVWNIPSHCFMWNGWLEYILITEKVHRGLIRLFFLLWKLADVFVSVLGWAFHSNVNFFVCFGCIIIHAGIFSIYRYSRCVPVGVGGWMGLGFDSPANCSHSHHCSSFDWGQKKASTCQEDQLFLSPQQLDSHGSSPTRFKKDVNQATLLYFFSACCW